MKKVRQLKVYERFRKIEEKQQRYGEIRLSGYWLEKAGFETGKKFKVFIKQNELTLKII